jgi:hypothetical protein
MYNKLFTKLLDSSIWLEDDQTRIVWVTFIAVMDERGFAQFATVENVARRANVTLAKAQKAIATLEGPDPNSSDADHDGRRIERVPGGWIILNAEKYRSLVTRSVIQAQTAARVRKCRENKRAALQSNAPVTPSEAEAETEVLSTQRPYGNGNGDKTDEAERGGRLLENYARWYSKFRNGARLRLMHNSLEFNDACALCATWDDARLERLAKIVLTTDEEWISGTDRGFRVFASRASWADDRLRQAETVVTP